MRRLEHSLQTAVADMLELVLDPERTYWSSLDHGVGKLGPAEARSRKRRGVKAGLPDVLILALIDNRPFMCGMELKAGKGELSAPQVATQQAWADVGFTIYVARSCQDVQDILARCRIPTRRRVVMP